MEITFYFHCFFSIWLFFFSSISSATDSYLLCGILFYLPHKLINMDFFSLQFLRWAWREGNKTSQDTSHWAYNWYVTNMSCTVSYTVSNQSKFDFWGPSETNSIPTCEKITAGMNSDGICAQTVRSSRQEGTITSSPMKPQIAQLIYLNIPQKVM